MNAIGAQQITQKGPLVSVIILQHDLEYLQLYTHPTKEFGNAMAELV